jgi:multiple sugar transport system ATP-binding protein
VADNIGFPLRIRGVAKRERQARVQEVALLLGISQLLRRYPRQLSGGERQRVALGRAIIRQPRVFLLDEPLSNLDANLRAAMRQELKRLHEYLEATFIYVTHDQDDALAMGDRVLVLAEGRAQQCDTPSGIYHEPASRFVASFVGRLPMNFFEGTLERHEGRMTFQGLDLYLPLQEWWPEGVEGTRAVLGMRPEAVLVREAPADGSVPGTVRWLEVVQPHVYATVQVGRHTIVARVPEGEDVRVGQAVWLLVTQRPHLFDPVSGWRMAPPVAVEGRSER